MTLSESSLEALRGSFAGASGLRRPSGWSLPSSFRVTAAGFAALSLFIFVCLSMPAAAVEPDEMLSDPVLEARARALDADIRCVQCRSENIASSNADWARDARLIVRELIFAGAGDAEVLDFFVERYGERVLMNPRKDGANAILWAAGPVMLVLALLIGAFHLRRRRAGREPPSLTEAEQARLDDILKG